MSEPPPDEMARARAPEASPDVGDDVLPADSALAGASRVSRTGPGPIAGPEVPPAGGLFSWVTGGHLPAGLLTRESIVRSRAAWIDAVLPTILIHAVLLAFAIVAVIVFRPSELQQKDWLDLWNKWDAQHFLDIAAHGYLPSEPARIVLFPLFPLLIAAGSIVFSPLAAGMVIALVSSVLAAVGLYRLVRLDTDRRTARLAALAMNLFPVAFAFVAPYSEPLFLALVVWSFLCARERRWAAAAVLAALAGATRIQGVFVLAALGVEYLVQERVFETHRLGRDAAWLAVGLLGPLAYLAINVAVFGDPLYFISVQRTVFHVQNVAPWTALADAVGNVRAAPWNESWLTVYLAPLVAFGILAVTTVWTFIGRESRLSYAVYAGLTLASFATLSWPISVPRYLLGAFPIFILGGRLGRVSWLGTSLAAASVLLLGVFTTLFVIGHWAF